MTWLGIVLLVIAALVVGALAALLVAWLYFLKLWSTGGR